MEHWTLESKGSPSSTKQIGWSCGTVDPTRWGARFGTAVRSLPWLKFQRLFATGSGSIFFRSHQASSLPVV